jgi:predicted phosphoribosyltransferase
MYFKSRTEAGKDLADKLAETYAGKPCCVIALSEGGVVVGLQIAKRLECVLSMLLVEPIELPGEIDPIGAISENGTFSFSNMYAPGEIEELMFDYRGVVEDEKRTKLSEMHQLVGAGTNMRLELLRNKHVILVTDGFSTGYALDIAIEVLKPVSTRSICAAAPIASPSAVDHLRVLCDRTFFLTITQNYLATDHYYDYRDVPEREDAVKVVQEIMSAWQAEGEGQETGQR